MAACPRCRAENSDTSKFCSDCGASLGPAGPDDVSATRPVERPADGWRPGSLVAGKYRIVAELGRGGMGVVYKAEDVRLQRSVALKFLPSELTHIAETTDRFRQEAQAAAALNHPNICVVYDVGEDDGRPYIAMEYVERSSTRSQADWVKPTAEAFSTST